MNDNTEEKYALIGCFALVGSILVYNRLSNSNKPDREAI